MYTLLIVLIIVAALLMVCAVLIQESKGGGLSSQYDGYKKLIGVRTANSFIERTTWVLAGIIVAISVLCSYVIR